MALFCFIILTTVWIAGREALSILDCGAHARPPGKKQACSGLGSRARHLWMLHWLLGKLITCLEESEMHLEETFLKMASDRVVIVRVHWHRRGLRHVHHRPDDSDLPRHLHGIQREPTDPQPRLGQPQLSWDARHVRGAAGGEIQLSHQRGKRLRE